MSNVTVQEALKNTLVMLDALTVEFGITGLEPLIAEVKAALSEIDKCEPSLMRINFGGIEGAWIKYDSTYIGKLIDGVSVDYAYTSPQPIEKCEPVANIFIDNGKVEIAIHKVSHNLIDGQMLYTSPQPCDWVDLSDSEWVNIVNHDHGYENFSKDDAVHEAVKMTEIKLKQLNTKG